MVTLVWLMIAFLVVRYVCIIAAIANKKDKNNGEE